MLSKEYNGLACEVADLNNRLIATGYLELLDDALEVHDISEHLPLLNLDTMVKISVRNPKLGMRVMAGRVYISNRSFLRVTELKNYADYEKRRFFRLAVDHSATLLMRLPAADGEMPQREKIPARIKDISLCGMQIEVGKRFVVGDRLTVSIAMYDNEEEELEIVVRRVIEQDGKPDCYGCELAELTSHAERRLCAFILRQQQEQIRRSRGG